MPNPPFDLVQSAHDEMIHEGFQPDFPPAVERQLASIQASPAALSSEIRDLRALLWSSIDNDTSRDLDQIEVAEQAQNGTLIRVAIADVDACVAPGTPIDVFAARETTSVYTPAKVFPMLPEKLSTDLTSLAPDRDRVAVVIEMLIAQDGAIAASDIYRAIVRNKAQLAYQSTGPWLDGQAPAPPSVAASQDLQRQLKLQNDAATRLRAERRRLGALEFDRVEAEPVMTNGLVDRIEARHTNAASLLIEDFMLAANQTMAAKLTSAGVPRIRRVVKQPERWPRIVELARAHGFQLPGQPDSAALSAFLEQQKRADPVHYPDLSLAIIKLMGPGEYVLATPGDDQGHFGLAANDYTHSTAPNRRYADLITQRLVKALIAHQPTPYSPDQLAQIAGNCTRMENAARKVERTTGKQAAALAVQKQIGQGFDGIVTGVTDKGVFVRLVKPPVEGRLMHGEQGLDVGDRVHVQLIGANPARGFIDFAR